MEIKQHTSEQTLNQRRSEKGNFKNYFKTNEMEAEKAILRGKCIRHTLRKKLLNKQFNSIP